jgi:hypothetical protein
MTLYNKKPKIPLLELIHEFSKVAGYKSNIQKLLLLLLLVVLELEFRSLLLLGKNSTT